MTEEIITLGTEYPLNGLLTLPDNTNSPVPACVLVHGSGSSDMNEHIGKVYPFRDIASELALHGIACLRYDKRSYTHGRRMLKEKKLITVKEETIEDAIKAADLLRSDPRIDSERIYVIGHSMGAMLAPRIDAEGGNFKGLILMAGSPYTLPDILIRQFDELASKSNFLLKAVIRKQKEKYEQLFADLETMSDEDAKKKNMGGGTTLYYFKEMNSHPAMDYLQNTEKPVLIMQGEKDFQAKADIDYQKYRELLQDRDNVTFRLYPDLNHLFMHSVYGDIAKVSKEYSKPQHIPSEVIADIADWIRNH